MNTFENSKAFAQQLDKADPLAAFRNEFIIPDHGGREHIYFLGNSLGLQPKRTNGKLQDVLASWGSYGVEGFFMGSEPWMKYHDQLTRPMSTIVGAFPHEVVVMNLLTINLHLMMVSFYRPQGKRNKIICEAKAFPSDQYMLETHVRHYGFNPDETIIEVHPREGEYNIRHEDILNTIEQHKDELALVLWGGVNYYTGQLFDMAGITKAGQAAGAKVGLDLAHAVGNVPVQLHDWNVDFACWCSYKYMNSGPGGVGAAYIHERYHKDPSLNRFAGWWGYERSTRFLMQKGFVPSASAEGWQTSTSSPLLYASLKASLEIFTEAGWENVQAKRQKLNQWLWFLLNDIEKTAGTDFIQFITPRHEQERGCQVSMHMLRDGKKIFDQLTAEGFIVDWREPSVIRLAPVPLYNTYEEVWTFANTIRKLIG